MLIPPICTPALTLAQATPARDPVPVFIWIGVLIGVLAIGGSIWVIFRRHLLAKESSAAVSGSLMEQLRAQHARGEISDAEYEQTRKSIASRVSQMLDTKRAGGLFELPDPKRRPPRPAAGSAAGLTAMPIMPPEERMSPRIPPNSAGSQQAPPGYDLTGEPLPKPADPE